MEIISLLLQWMRTGWKHALLPAQLANRHGGLWCGARCRLEVVILILGQRITTGNAARALVPVFVDPP